MQHMLTDSDITVNNVVNKAKNHLSIGIGIPILMRNLFKRKSYDIIHIL